MKFLLSEMEKGAEGILMGPVGEGALPLRLGQFGMIPGTRICHIGSAPLGSPMLFRVRGAVIALRKEDCKKLYGVVL